MVFRVCLVNIVTCYLQIYYIGLAGEWTAAPRTGVVMAVYEARPMPQDHKQELEVSISRKPTLHSVFWSRFRVDL